MYFSTFTGMKTRITSWLIIIWLIAPLTGISQNTNPFEITPRLPQQPVVNDTEETVGTGNPFDITPGANITVRRSEPIPEIKPLVSNGKDRFYFSITIFQLLLLASLVTLLRGTIFKVLQAFTSDNLFNQLFRERIARGHLSFTLLLSLFFLNAGLLLFHLTADNGNPSFLGFYNWLGILTGAVIVIFLLKFLLIGIVGFIFPVANEMFRYRFLITIFSIVLGLALVPINLLLTYGPQNTAQNVVYLAAAVVGLLYVFRTLRALLIANRKVSIFSFHFFLYICTIEIAPALIIWKLISNQL